MVSSPSLWIQGSTRSGKTDRLIQQLGIWLAAQHGSEAAQPSPSAGRDHQTSRGILVFSATGDNRLELADRITVATEGQPPFHSTTPMGFFEDEVSLFWSLLVQQLNLTAQFPLRLAPETEQELASSLWQADLDPIISQASGITAPRLVRRILDLLQLAALSGVTLAEIPTILEQGLVRQSQDFPLPYPLVARLLQQWQNWCLDRGLLTYGIIACLYNQHLLPDPTYRQHLRRRFQWVLADDVDEYPAIARPLFEALLDGGACAVFTYNPNGSIRLGLGADPAYLAGLAVRCDIKALPEPSTANLASTIGSSILDLVFNPLCFATLPESVQVIQTVARSQLLRRTAEVIIEAVETRQVQPRDIAIIGPGLDEIARYSLIQILAARQIPVESLNDQRPLNSVPIIRALLTLLALVYPGLGRLVDKEAVAEMLVVFSGQAQQQEPAAADPPTTDGIAFQIDPVRAGLLADYCFAPHPESPRLLPAQTFPRWDRLGYRATTAYDAIAQWIANQQEQLRQRLIPTAVVLLDRAIQQFLFGGGHLSFAQLSALRQLMDTAQHYAEVNRRVQRGSRSEAPAAMMVGQLIQLLRSGAITANPYPVRPTGPASNAVTLATVFQYRSSRRVHRWQFWLDAGSPRWLSGVDALFAAPLFLSSWSGRQWTAADTLAANEQRLHRILLDLLGRTEERVYLCHSDLATDGQEQTGILLSLVNAAAPLSAVS